MPVLDRIGNVMKHILLLTDDRGGDRGGGDSEGCALHKDDVDGEHLKAFMTTDALSPDVPIVDTSPGFQVASLATPPLAAVFFAACFCSTTCLCVYDPMHVLCYYNIFTLILNTGLL